MVKTEHWLTVVTVAFFFAYTVVRTLEQNLAFTCVIYLTVNIYYGSLYGYTPEVLPSAHRGTGNGRAEGLNRIMGIISVIVATYGNAASSVPIYVCAALYGIMAVVVAVFPYEPAKERAM